MRQTSRCRSPPAPVVGADGQQSGELALTPGVRLERHGGVAGHPAQGRLELVDELPVPGGVLLGGERVQVGELRPRDRQHLRGSVQLHGAGAEGDHGAVQRQVEVGETSQVPHHLGLRPVPGEHLVLEVGRRAPLGLRQAGQRSGGRLGRCDDLGLVGVDPERGEDTDHGGGRGGLVEADPDEAVGTGTEQEPALPGLGHHLGRPVGPHADRVEPGGSHVQPRRGQSVGHHAGQSVGPGGDAPEAGRSVPGGVQPGDHGEQHLGGADVRGGLLPADVLLACLEGQAQRRRAVRVDRHPHEAAGERPLLGVTDRHEPGVGTSVTHGHPEALCGTDHHVGAHLTGRLEQAAGEEVGRDGDERSTVVRPSDHGGEVPDPSAGTRVGDEDAEGVVRLEVGLRVAHDDLEPQRLGPGGDDLDHLGVAVGVDQEHLAGRPGRPTEQGHRLGCGGGLVEQGGVRHVHAGEVRHHRLEVEQRLEATLGDLRLVRGVRRVPGGVLEHVAEDDRWRDGAVVAAADQRGVHPVAGSDAPEPIQGGLLVQAGESQGFTLPDVRGHHGVEELVEGVEPEGGQHGADLVGVRPDVTVGEVARWVLGHGVLQGAGGGGSPPAVVGPESFERPEPVFPRR